VEATKVHPRQRPSLDDWLGIANRLTGGFRETTGQASLVKVNAGGILLYQLGGESFPARFSAQEKHIAVVEQFYPVVKEG
jgi:hypothetical protein